MNKYIYERLDLLGEPMTHDEALFWMNDRLGRFAGVRVGLRSVVGACGTLTHDAQEDMDDDDFVSEPGDEELYAIGGDAHVWLPHDAVYVGEERFLRLMTVEGITVVVTVP